MGMQVRLGLLAGLLTLTAASAMNGEQWTAQERALIDSMHIGRLAPAAPDRSNAVESLPAAAALGKKLFFDARLSANGKVSCASCHLPDSQFQDNRPLGVGIATGKRRTMPVAESGRGPWLFWDGRKDSPWSQALGPMEDPAEHGGNRTAYVRTVAEQYKADYEAVFRQLPDLSGLPAGASPLGGTAEKQAWNAMSQQQRDAVSRVFANIGKAIAAYEKTLQFGPSRLDRYIEGSGQLTVAEQRGLRVFIGKGQCITCHAGPLLTDQHFHNTGVPARPGMPADPGRAAAIGTVQRDEFNCLGPYSDADRNECGELEFMAADDPHMAGAFKTPGLRGVAGRAPYMHAGQLATLPDVVRHYANAPKSAIGRNERKPVALSESEVADLVSFLATLDSPVIERPR